MLRLKDLFSGQPKDRCFTSEEEFFAADVGRLDHEDPSWDHPGLVAGAQRMIELGHPQRLVMATYGRDITEETQEKLQASMGPPRPQ